MNHDGIDSRVHARLWEKRFRHVTRWSDQQHRFRDRTDLADESSIDVIRQLVRQLPDRERLDARHFPQPCSHVSSDVPHFMLEDVAVSGVHHHPAIASRGESLSERGRLMLFTSVEISIGKIVTVDFETETQGRPHRIRESWVVRVESRSRSRIPAGFQCRAGFGDCLGAIVREPRRTKRSKCLFDPGAMFRDGMSLHDEDQPSFPRDFGNGISPRRHDERRF